MTNTYQETQENGHNSEHTNSENENYSNNLIAAASSQDLASLNSIEEQLRAWRQKNSIITKLMHKAGDILALAKVTAQEVRDKIECDRAIVFRFDSEQSGVAIAEFKTKGWTPTFNENLPTVFFGLETNQEYIEPVIQDNQSDDISPYQEQLLEKYQVKSSLSVPLILNNQVWGLLVVQSCANARQWQEVEINLLSQITTEFALRLQEFAMQAKLETEINEYKLLNKIVDKIHRTSSVENLFQTTTQELRQMIQCDRIAVYRFNPDWTGEFVAESVASGWVPLVGPDIKTVWEDSYLQENEGGRYKRHESLVANDIYKMNFAPCHIEILEQFQVRSYVIVPVFRGNQLWGMLAAYQNSAPRQWQNWEVQLLSKFAVNFGIAITQVQSNQKNQEQTQKLARTNEYQQSLIALTHKISELLTEKVTDASALDSLLQITIKNVRRLLETDRIVIYRFNPDFSGEFIAESMNKDLLSFKEKQIDEKLLAKNGDCQNLRSLASIYKARDTHLQDTKGGRYQQKMAFAVDDVYKANFPPCYMDLLEQFEAKAYLTVPIFKEDQLWGLLATYQHSSTRHWEDYEINIMRQIAVLLGVAIQQAETFSQLQQQSQKVTKAAELEHLVTTIVDNIRQSFDLESIFNNATKEVRSQLKADRVVIFQFKPDWSGEFVAESVGSNWVRLVTPTSKTVWADSYLQETKGGRYRNGEYFVANDMYKAGHADCHIEILEQYQARAYVIVPILQGANLWGLMAAYQNSGPREWEETEVSLLVRIGDQLGIALQQAEYLQQLQVKKQEIEVTAQRDRSAEIIIDKIREQQDISTIFDILTTETRSLFKTDRVAVYKFNPDWSGLFVCESVGDGWVSLVDNQYKIPRLQESISDCRGMRNFFTSTKDDTNFKTSTDTYLQSTEGGELSNRKVHVRSDIHNSGFSPCYVKVLEEYQAKAYAIVPIFQGQKLWGLLAAYENAGIREWKESEVSCLTRIGDQFGVVLQHIDYLQQLEEKSQKIATIAERDRTVAMLIEKIRQSTDLDSIFQIATKQIRLLLDTDRVAVYKFNPDWSGLFVFESVDHKWVSLMDKQDRIPRLQENISKCYGKKDLFAMSDATGKHSADTYMQTTKGGEFSNGKAYVRSDIYNAGFAPCYIEVMEEYQAKAYAIVPIFQGQKLWGVLAAFQNSRTRDWEESEINLLTRIGNQFGMALQQAEFLQRFQIQSEQVIEAAAREQEAKEYLQKGSMKLLSAVRPALNGDLTVRAPITEDELGTIADAYNNTLQALRQIVIQVQAAAQQVASTSSQSNASLSGLTVLAQQQSKELNEALGEVQQMVDSTQAVVGNAELVQLTVQQANQTVQSGDDAMNRTVEAIQAIRETVSQTSKKIKRLSESSQKISKVVSLISNFATQTNVLALNAAIEATRAGEYGKGFAVVADEVRSLSRQSAAATIEIEKLVQEIQEETGEVAVAMEAGIQQVVEGTSLVNETRMNLNAIVVATAEISNLLQQITDATQGQMLQSVSVTASMKDVAKIANKTSVEAGNIGIVFQQLSEMAQELLLSVSKFKVN